jgi:hypothetical protein
MPTAAAEGKPEGGCSPEFQLMTERRLIRLAPAFEEPIRKADRNEDDYLCVKFDKKGNAFTYTDNNRPLASQ